MEEMQQKAKAWYLLHPLGQKIFKNIDLFREHLNVFYQRQFLF